MDDGPQLPRYQFRPDPPSFWDVARRGVSDIASVIPASILSDPAVQLPGRGTPLVVSEPDLVREVLNDKDGHFTRYHTIRRLMRRSWGKGLAAAEGEDWKRQRRAAAPAFTPSAVAGRIDAFASAAGKCAATWPHGECVELTKRVAQIIADIIFTTLVDGKGAVDTATMASDMPAYINRISTFGTLDLLPLPESLHDQIRGIPGDPAIQRVRALARKLAEDRNGSGGDDLIALMSGHGPIEDNILGLFPAAMDTTVSGTCWALYVLAQYPDWQARVAAEARACEGTFTPDRLPVTRRVVQEVLRLYPPAPLLARGSAGDTELGSFRLQKGQPVLLSLYAMQRHHRHWDNPDHFDPDRFLPERGQHVGWLPFGAGQRVCIAAQFAQAEIAVVVARLLSEVELEPAGEAPRVTLQVTTRSANGLHVVAQRRPD